VQAWVDRRVLAGPAPDRARPVAVAERSDCLATAGAAKWRHAELLQGRNVIRIFRHYLPKGLVILGLSEVFVLWGALYLGSQVRYGGFATQAHLTATSGRALLFVVVMWVVMTAFGLYQRELKEGQWGYFPRLIVSLSLGFLVFCTLLPILPSLVLPPAVLASVVLVALCGTILTRLMYLAVANRAAVHRQVLVLGTGRRARAIQALAQGSPGRPGFQVVGFMPCGEREDRGGPLVLRSDQSLAAIARSYRVTEIVVGSRDRRQTLPVNELLECKLAGTRVMDLTTFFERESGRIELESLNTSWLVFADGFEQGVLKTWIKRIFDVAASIALLIVCLPIMVITAILVKFEDNGPVLYRQDRVGQAGRVFPLFKFRSMRVNAENDGTPQWASHNDSRVTRIGAFIRKVRIDELPQVFNVLRGDMSFVGPRPERPFFVDKLARDIPYYGYRHTIKPGITGWAQVRYPYGASVEDAIEKLKYDLYYVKNNTLFLDLIILFQTIQVVIFQDGAR
jgi:sugar transferase (PEP-CTERM system associated)